MIELGVNIDHVATIRQARCTYEPDPVWAAVEAHLGGADGITIHLREDRRHIQDADVERLRDLTQIKLNLEMAATDEMVAIACRIKPQMAMLVPEGRHEVTTEGGLDVVGQEAGCASRWLACAMPASSPASSSMPNRRRSKRRRASARACAKFTPALCPRLLYPGARCRKPGGACRTRKDPPCRRRGPRSLGMRFNAGHALNYFNVQPVARCPASASCTSATRSSAARSSSACAKPCAEMKRLMREAQVQALTRPTRP
jgi:pyridoxine 5-phosphate synthase